MSTADLLDRLTHRRVCSRRRYHWLASLWLLAISSLASAQTVELAKLLANDGTTGDNFGYSVAVSGNTAIVGALLDDDNGNNSGATYIFVQDATGTWNQVAKLTASDAAADDQFGYSVAISGDTAVVGARFNDDAGPDSSSGSAYIFEKGVNWTQTQKITASDAAADDLFGSSVAISGDTVIVGAYGNSDAGFFSGAAYIFEKGANWPATETQKITASDATTFDQFGLSVGISGDTAIVGAYLDDGAGADSGAAYIVEKGANWPTTETQKITASDAAGFEQFGYSVAISGATAIVGANLDDTGSAYVFGLTCPLSLDLPAASWSMVGLGCDLSTPGDTVQDVFGDDLALADYETIWVVFEQNLGTRTYRKLLLGDALTTTRGYWIYTTNATTVSIEGAPNTAQDIPVFGDASGQMNLNGNFFPNDICWEDAEYFDGVSFVPIAGADPSCATSSPDPACDVAATAWRWNGAAYETFSSNVPGLDNTIAVGEAIWTRFFGNASLRFNNTGACPEARTRPAPDEWYQRLAVSADGLSDGFKGNILGQSRRALDGFDALDLPDLAPSFRPFLTLSFPRPGWEDFAGDYNTDFRAVDGNTEDYAFEVRSDRVRTITLHWEDPDAQLHRVTLVDVESGEAIRPTANGAYTTTMSATTHRFIWRVEGQPTPLHADGFE